MLKIKTAVMSVSDKAGLVEFAKFLAGRGVEIISTGGTAKILEENGVKITPINQITKNEKDDYFDGRMKTISFQFESGLLYRRDKDEHVKQAAELGIPRIDLVICNLYPFEKVTENPNISVEKAVENIDIGGPCMVRAAAKNHDGVAIVVDPARYPDIMKEMEENDGCIPPETRRQLSAEAFARTADYDSAISAFFAGRFLGKMEKRLRYDGGRQLGRYAENWHQKGWLYKCPAPGEPTVPHARQVLGGPLGYNNYLDGEAALTAALAFSDKIAVSVIKHSNPCGLATGDSLVEAFERAWQGNPVSAFGSVIAITRPLDMDTVKILAERFVEVLLAPEADQKLLDFLGEKKAGLRVLVYEEPGGKKPETSLRFVAGGLLEQELDNKYYLSESAAALCAPAAEMECANSGKKLRVGVVTRKSPPAARAGLYDFVLRHVKFVKSNAICIAREYAPGKYQILGMGCGQPNRRDSVALAGERARANLQREYFAKKIGKGDRGAYVSEKINANPDALTEYLKNEIGYVNNCLAADNVVLASDAFFPFRDGLDNAAATGVKHILQPGGSMRDEEVIAAAEEHGIAMVFTGVRKFYH